MAGTTLRVLVLLDGTFCGMDQVFRRQEQQGCGELDQQPVGSKGAGL
jgi:hypothetical protein